MKNQILLFSILFGLTSCSSLRRGTTNSTAGKSTQPPKPGTQAKGKPAFIETISIKPASNQSSGKSTTTTYAAMSNEPETEENILAGSPATSGIFFKYAILLDIPVEEITDLKLVEFMESWYGAPYRYGGNDRNGVDCSAFSKDFISSLYGLSIPRVSAEQYRQSKRVSKSDLQEGDLVFFYTRGRRRGVSHVGVYLRNNKFVHAATSGGVMISDLDEIYYKRTYAGAGRVR